MSETYEVITFVKVEIETESGPPTDEEILKALANHSSEIELSEVSVWGLIWEILKWRFNLGKDAG